MQRLIVRICEWPVNTETSSKHSQTSCVHYTLCLGMHLGSKMAWASMPVWSTMASCRAIRLHTGMIKHYSISSTLRGGARGSMTNTALPMHPCGLGSGRILPPGCLEDMQKMLEP